MKLKLSLTDDSNQEICNDIELFIPDGDLTHVIKKSTAGIYTKAMEECCELAASLSKLSLCLSDDEKENRKRYANTASEFIDVLIHMMLVIHQNPQIGLFFREEVVAKEGRFIRRVGMNKAIFKNETARAFAMSILLMDKPAKPKKNKTQDVQINEELKRLEERRAYLKKLWATNGFRADNLTSGNPTKRKEGS